MKNLQIILAIETSCDETSVAIVGADIAFNKALKSIYIFSHIVETQIPIHQLFGGVVPEIAARDHLAKIDMVTKKALENAGIKLTDIHKIAVTFGPGLLGALMVGVLYAQGLATSLNIPLVSINHIDAHLAPAIFTPTFAIKEDIFCPSIEYPALALTVSGGHCHLSRILSTTDRILLGSSLDDACGEAFDKVAKLLGFPYPGGVSIEKTAKTINTSRYTFNSILNTKENELNFSYSGLKTAILNEVRKLSDVEKTPQKRKNPLEKAKEKLSGANLDTQIKAELCYAFQESALGQLIDRLKNAVQIYGDTKTILIAGGVAANNKFRELLYNFVNNYNNNLFLHIAPSQLCSDNGTMIALHAFISDESGFLKKPFTKY